MATETQETLLIEEKETPSSSAQETKAPQKTVKELYQEAEQFIEQTDIDNAKKLYKRAYTALHPTKVYSPQDYLYAAMAGQRLLSFLASQEVQDLTAYRGQISMLFRSIGSTPKFSDEDQRIYNELLAAQQPTPAQRKIVQQATQPPASSGFFSGPHGERNTALTLGATALVLEGVTAAATFWFAKDAMDKALGVPEIRGWEMSRGEGAMIGVAVLIGIAALVMWAANREPKKDGDEEETSCWDVFRYSFMGYGTGEI